MFESLYSDQSDRGPRAPGFVFGCAGASGSGKAEGRPQGAGLRMVLFRAFLPQAFLRSRPQAPVTVAAAKAIFSRSHARKGCTPLVKAGESMARKPEPFAAPR